MNSRTRFGFAAALMVSIGTASTSFAPLASCEPGDLNLWPLKKGNSWTLLTTVFDPATKKNTMLDQVLTVTDVKPSSGGSDVTITYKMGGKLTQMERFHVTAAGMFKVGGGPDGTSPLTPPLPQFKYPIKVGAAWNWKGTIGTPKAAIPSEAAYSVPNMQSLTVFGHKVQAYKFHLKLTVSAPGQTSEFVNDSWYAPNIGIVKQHLEMGKVTVDCTLSKYTLAK